MNIVDARARVQQQSQTLHVVPPRGGEQAVSGRCVERRALRQEECREPRIARPRHGEEERRTRIAAEWLVDGESEPEQPFHEANLPGRWHA